MLIMSRFCDNGLENRSSKSQFISNIYENYLNDPTTAQNLNHGMIFPIFAIHLFIHLVSIVNKDHWNKTLDRISWNRETH